MSSRRDRGAVALEHALVPLAPLATLWLILLWHGRHVVGVDFTQEYWVASRRVLEGQNPYIWSHFQIEHGVSFPYPALTALLLAPFALVPAGLATLIFIAVSMAALVFTLRALAVHDWRVYLLAFLWWPVLNTWQTSNVTLLLCLGVAAVWRYRDRPWIAGLAAAAVISIKPFVWPIALWLLFSRRYRSVGWTAVWGLVLNIVAWGMVGYSRLADYLHLSATVTSDLKRSGYAVIAQVARFGAPVWLGEALMAVVVILLIVACRRAARAGDERRSMLLCVLLMLAASPLVWNHYFALLIVPLAIYRPRVSLEWVVGLLFWLCPGSYLYEWEAALAAVLTVAISCRLVRRAPAESQKIMPPRAELASDLG